MTVALSDGYSGRLNPTGFRAQYPGQASSGEYCESPGSFPYAGYSAPRSTDVAIPPQTTALPSLLRSQ